MLHHPTRLAQGRRHQQLLAFAAWLAEKREVQCDMLLGGSSIMIITGCRDQPDNRSVVVHREHLGVSVTRRTRRFVIGRSCPVSATPIDSVFEKIFRDGQLFEHRVPSAIVQSLHEGCWARVVGSPPLNKTLQLPLLARIALVRNNRVPQPLCYGGDLLAKHINPRSHTVDVKPFRLSADLRPAERRAVGDVGA